MELMAANDASLGSRLLDMALEDGAPRSSLAGLFPANLALSSLEDALMPLAATLPHLHPSSGRSVKIARRQAKRAQAKHPNMSIDKCTAIVLYTMEEFPRETSLYYALNLALRNQMRHVVRPWRDYVWLLLHALRELPPSTEVIVFRGCKTTPADLGLELTKGFEFTWSAFTSTATTQGVMQTFVGQDDGPRTLMTIKMTEQIGRDVRDFSVSPGENEILYPPNLCFEIVDSFDAGHGLIMVQCQQTETIDGILDLASSTSEVEEVGWLQQMFGAPSQRGVEAAAEKAAAEKAAVEKAELDEAVNMGSISTLIKFVTSGTDAGKENAARALRNLAVNADNQIAIATKGGIEPLIALVKSGTDVGKEKAAGALWNLAVNADNKIAIATKGGLEPLIALVKSGTDAGKEHAADALLILDSILAVNADNRARGGRGGRWY